MNERQHGRAKNWAGFDIDTNITTMGRLTETANTEKKRKNAKNRALLRQNIKVI